MIKRQCPCCGSTAQVRLEDCKWLPDREAFEMTFRCGCGAHFGTIYEETEITIFESSSSTDHQ